MSCMRSHVINFNIHITKHFISINRASGRIFFHTPSCVWLCNINLTMIFVACVAVLAALFYYKFIKPMSYWKNRGVPQSSPLWFFGDSLHTFVTRKMHQATLVHSLTKKFSESRYFGIYNFLAPQLVVKDPELIKQITVKDFDYFSAHSVLFTIAGNDDLWKNNLLGLAGQEWRDNRTLLSPSFTANRTKAMYQQTSDCVQNCIKFLKDQNEKLVKVNIFDTAGRITSDAIAINAFGVKTNSFVDKTNEFYTTGQNSLKMEGLQAFKLMLSVSFPKLMSMLKIQFFPAEVRHFFKNIVDETVKLREENNVVRPDVIQLLMEARKHHVDISNTTITSHAFLFFVGGFDTVSSVLSFTLYELALNPDIQDRLRSEILEVKERDEEIKYESMMNLKYMDMVLSESMRKWPVMFQIDRKCTKPYTIQPVNPGEKPITIEPEVSVVIPIYSLHHDPEIFPEPEKFDPERFNEDNKKNVSNYTYIPFGNGPRICVGARFAMMEMKTMLFHLLASFEVVPVKETKSKITLCGKKIGFKPREDLVIGFKPMEAGL